MGFFGGAAKGINELQDRRTQQRNSSIDELVKMAQLKELGYGVEQGKGGMFGGGQMTLTQDPNFTSTKSLEREKLTLGNEKLRRENEAFQKFGQGASGGVGEDSNSPLILDPITGKPRNNPAYLDALKQKKLEVMNEKQKSDIESQKNKEDMLRQNAQGQLSAIQEAKKGIKYFGAMGNVPSVVAPSTILTGGKEYGPRKEWENNVNKLLSGRIIDLMNQMKQASKTGATGFGQLNKSELQLITNASNVLSKDLPPDIAQKYLNDLEPIYQKMIGGGSGGGENQNLPQNVNPEEYAKAKQLGYSDEEIMNYLKQIGAS